LSATMMPSKRDSEEAAVIANFYCQSGSDR